MKYARLLIITLLALMSASNVQSQTIENGDAFYIYRNDGDFDGFFFDQVEEMRYSKLDLNGVEQADFVVQEVVTPDSIYRIPIAAIDSIGFVQPEIKFNPKVRHMDFLGMTDYVTAVDDMTLTFKSSMPTSLKPKVGDMLLGFTGVLERDGFGGRVTNVNSSGGNIVVTCQRPENLSDIFDQFIMLEMVGTDESGAKAVRRIAGYDQLKNALTSQGSISKTLFDFNLNTHIPFFPEPLILNLDLSLAIKMRQAMVYQIKDNNAYIKAMLNTGFNFQSSVVLGISASGFKELPLIPPVGIKFPAVCPLFEIRPIPNFGIRYGGDFKFKINLPSISRNICQTFVIDTQASPMMRYSEKSDGSQNQSWSEFLSGTGTEVSLNGMVQLGVKHQSGIYTNSWISNIFDAGIGADFFIGPKIEGSVAIGTTFAELQDGPYNLRNNKLAWTWLSADYEVYGYVKFCDTNDKYTFADGSRALTERNEARMFPSLDLKSAAYNSDSKNINAKMETDECYVFWPSQIGIGVMKDDNILKSSYLASLKFGDKAPETIQTSFSASDLKPGMYSVRPLLRAFNGEYPIKSQTRTVNVPVIIELPDKVTVPAKGNDCVINVKTNGTISAVDASGLSSTIENNKIIKVSVPDNDRFSKIQYPVRVQASAEGAGTSTATMVIEQPPMPGDFWKYANINYGIFSTYTGTEIEDDFAHPIYGKTPCTVTILGDNRIHVSGSYSSQHTITGAPNVTSSNLSIAVYEGNASINENIKWSYEFYIDYNTNTFSGYGSSEIVSSGSTPDFSQTVKESWDFNIPENTPMGNGVECTHFFRSENSESDEPWEFKEEEMYSVLIELEKEDVNEE